VNWGINILGRDRELSTTPGRYQPFGGDGGSGTFIDVEPYAGSALPGVDHRVHRRRFLIYKVRFRRRVPPAQASRRPATPEPEDCGPKLSPIRSPDLEDAPAFVPLPGLE